MKLRTTFFYLFLTAILFVAISCGNKTAFTIKHGHTINSNKQLPIEKTNWVVQDLKFSKNIHDINLVKSNGKEIFGITSNSIAYYDGNLFKNILEFTDTNIVDMDFNKGFMAYSVHPVWSNYNLMHALYISRIDVKNKDVKIISTKIFPIPFSQSITGVRFLKRNQILLTSFLEYGLVNIVTKSGGDFNITFRHFPFNSYNIDVRLETGLTYDGKDLLMFGGMGVNLLQHYRGGKYVLRELFNLSSGNTSRADERHIIKIAFLNTSFGTLLTNDNLIYYSKKRNSNLTVFTPVNYIHLKNSDSIRTKDIIDIKLLDDSDFVCVTSGGLLLKQRIKTDSPAAISWEFLAHAPVTIPNYLHIINKDSLMLTDANKLFLITRKPYKENLNQRNRLNDNPYFSIERLAQPSTSYGVGIGDLDNNFSDDIYLVDVYDKNKLFTSLPNINNIPENLAGQRGIVGRTSSSFPGKLTYDLDLGVAIGDINEDGSEDVILTNLAFSNSLYLNNGKGYFQDVTKEYNFNVNMWRSEGAVLADVNNDGYLDVLCTSFFKSNRLFINNHGISLDDKTQNYGLNSKGRSISAVFGDVNNDGYPDLYVGNWMKDNKLFFNNGNGKFIDHTKESGVGIGDFKETNSVFFADLNNDGYLDLFVGNRAGGNKLFLNNGDGTFKDVTNQCGLEGNIFTYGAVFGDFDNDGWQDIALACLGGIKYFKNLGTDSKGMIHFRDITNSVIPPGTILSAYNTGLATADFGHKGFLDLVMNQNGGYTYFLLNENRLNGKNNYLSVKVEGDESNRDAVGAKLKLYYKNRLIGYREISGGYGYASSSSKIQHFGLGNLADSLSLIVNFPESHITKIISVQPNTFITVLENTGFKRNYYLAKKSLLRFFYGDGFIILGFELLILLLLFVALISFAAQKLNIQKNPKKKIYINRKLILSSLVVFYIVKFISIESMSFYFGPVYFILNSKNLFTDEILPLIISSIFSVSILLIIKNKEARSFAAYNVLDNLLTILKRFGHGEGMLIVLHRLSLLIENLDMSSDTRSDYNKEALERINSAFSEYKNAVLPEIKKIYNLLNQLDTKKDKYMQKINFFGNAGYILQSSAQISANCELLLSGSLLKEKIKAKEEAIFSIKKLREELSKIRTIIQSNFSIEVIEAVVLAIKKFSEQNPSVSIQFVQAVEKVETVISSADFNEVINIIMKNAIDELNESKISNGIVKIEVSRTDEKAVIKIEDNGRGITDENLLKIFAEGFTTKAYGHGIGLWIAKNCLEKYEGSISVESGALGGALFILQLKSI